MHIINDICYADTTDDEIRIIKVKPLTGQMLMVTFQSGEVRLFDTTKLKGSAFLPLANEEIFNAVTLFHGIPTWMNGEIDIAPETVYAQSYPYDSANEDCISA